MISVSFSKNNLQVKASYGSPPPCTLGCWLIVLTRERGPVSQSEGKKVTLSGPNRTPDSLMSPGPKWFVGCGSAWGWGSLIWAYCRLCPRLTFGQIRDYPRLSPSANLKLPWSPSCEIVHSGSTQESHPNSSSDPCFVIMSLKRTNFSNHGTHTPTRIPLVIMSTGLNVLAKNRRNWQVNFIDSALKVATTRFQRFLRGKNVLFQ